MPDFSLASAIVKPPPASENYKIAISTI